MFRREGREDRPSRLDDGILAAKAPREPEHPLGQTVTAALWQTPDVSGCHQNIQQALDGGFGKPSAVRQLFDQTDRAPVQRFQHEQATQQHLRWRRPLVHWVSRCRRRRGHPDRLIPLRGILKDFASGFREPSA
jgi:hypothetical protein